MNLAAQAGVRYSFENPKSYTDSNIIGFINLIEMIKQYKPKSLFLPHLALFTEILNHFQNRKHLI